ncbi:MAG TPA: DUF924 family protein [Steroidobacteraceae bacterium]|nr:DUF924 family protein [Steroidobacteraceae bacterium]
MDEARQVRDFWFGKLPLTAEAVDERVELWFGNKGREAVDETIRTRFGGLAGRAATGSLDGWADSPRRCLSLILLLDQFPRNIHRGTERAFACDAKALALTLSGIQSAADAALDIVERIFFYMPLQHSEAREVQDESVAAFRRLAREAPGPLRGLFEESLRSAERHREIIERFGRFPHRNEALGRASTPAEDLWLKSHGRMGQ